MLVKVTLVEVIVLNFNIIGSSLVQIIWHKQKREIFHSLFLSFLKLTIIE